jgi:acyl carrier protein
MTKTILERLKTLLLNEYNIDVGLIKTDAPIQSLGLDSLDMVDFFYAIEKEFKIKLPTQNLDLKSVQDLIALVERTVKEQTPGQPLNPKTE